MSSRISYMGTKHELAAQVATVIDGCRKGKLLDAFAGMGAVAEAHADKRQVWTNDVQHFAYLAGRCRFADPTGPLPVATMRKLAAPFYRENLACLRDQNQKAWKAAANLRRAANFNEFDRAFRKVAQEQFGGAGAYSCFFTRYANSYFSLKQSAEIDSIRYALEILRGRGVMTPSQFDWGLLTLGHAVLRVANTTGHFAQFLKPSEQNYRRISKQFGRSVWDQWLESLRSLSPVGTPEWRSNNNATRSDCDALLRMIGSSGDVGVVYCDPPYTDDHYSRFYHVWETLVLYDYPVVDGVGIYRPDRFATEFSLKSKVSDAFAALVKSVASTGADLVLSYPSNGLLHDVGGHPLDVLRTAYPKAQLVAEIEHNHSTMGASKGKATSTVAECIYLAQA